MGDTFADTSGHFTFENVQPGACILQVVVDNFGTIDQDVYVDNLDPRGATMILVSARPEAVPKSGQSRGVVDVSEFLNGYSKKAVDHYKKGLDNRKKGKNDLAIKSFEEAVNIEPDFYAAHNELGIAYQEAGRKDDAEREFLRARELNRSDVGPLINLTKLYTEANQGDRAVAVGEEAVKANSRSAPAFFNLGVALYKISMLDRAEAALRKALDLAPKMFEVRLMLANVYLKQQRYDKLMEQLDRYLAEDPKGEQRQAAEQMREALIKSQQEASR
jgi:tetratricopeptide (TPR) repeat protein